jgi:hypothetical protein
MLPPLFTQEFCHPVKVAGSNLADGEWEQCLSKADSQECDSNVNVCIWNNGADLIPENEYCAPYYMTPNVTLIKECINAEKD